MSAAPIDLSAGLVPAPSIDLSGGLVPRQAAAAPQDAADYQPPVPGVPAVNMRPISPKEAVTGKVDPMLSGATPDASQATVGNYGQDALPSIGKGAKEIFTPGQRMRGATDVLHGVNDALGSSILPIGAAPGAVVAGMAGSVAGSYLAPKVVQKLGGSQQAQDLAREAGAALPLAAGVGADLIRGEHGVQPDFQPKPVEPNAEYPRQLALPAGEPAAADAPSAPAPVTHPLGRVVAIDHESGLPIVDRSQPSEALTAEGATLPPQTRVAGEMSPDAEAVSKAAQDAAQPVSQDVPRGTPAPLKELAAEATNQPQPVGQTDPESGRTIVQPTDNPAALEKVAPTQAPALEDGLKAALANVEGADFQRVRDSKDPSRLAEKITDEGQPANSVSDYLASQVTVDSPAAKDAAVAAISKQFPVVDMQDKFSDGDDTYKYRHVTLQVQTPSGLSAEVQIVPKEVFEANPDQHKDYKAARNADLDGNTKEFEEKAAIARQKNDDAMQAFNDRNAAGDISAGLVPRQNASSISQQTNEIEKPGHVVSSSLRQESKWAKGQAVTLADGSSGKIAYVDKNLKIARIRTADGTSRTVNQKDITPEAPNGRISVGNAAVDDRSNEQEIAAQKEEGPAAISSKIGGADRAGSGEEELVGAGASKGTKLYSGAAPLDPEAWKQAFPGAADAVRRMVTETGEHIKEARNLQNGLFTLESQGVADILRAKQFLEKVPGTAGDQEAIYHHLEDPKVALTKAQEDILEKYVDPMMATTESMSRAMYGSKGDDLTYVHRIAKDKGSLLDKVADGDKPTGRGSALRKSTSSGKSRTMMALQDESGNRRVVSVKNGRVTQWQGGVTRDIGALRSGITNHGEIMDERIAPLERQVQKLEGEKRILSQTKSRAEAAKRRLDNIDAKLKETQSQIDSIKDEYASKDLYGKLWQEKQATVNGKNVPGKVWKFVNATTKEIEAHTPVRYYHNAAASAVTNYLEVSRAYRAQQFLEGLKESPEFARVAIKPKNPGEIPEGYQPTKLMNFAGYYFEPHTAEVLDWYAKRIGGETPGVWDKIGNFLRTAIFFNPLIHTKNIANHWTVEKGVSGIVNPAGWARSGRAGVKAINAVMHQNQDYLDALDAGAPLVSHRYEINHFADSLLAKMADEMKANPTVAQKVGEALGYARPDRLIKAIYDMSGKITWWTQDIAYLQATYEKVDKGMPFKAALDETSKHIPDYRVPTRIFNSKNLGKLMTNPKLTMFGSYHYGMLKAYGEAIKSATGHNFEEVGNDEKGRPVNEAGHTHIQEIASGWDKLAALGLITFVVYPQLDKLLQKVTGKSTARLARSGASTLADKIYQVAKGRATPTDLAMSVVTPAAHTQAAIELATNHDLRTGRQIINLHQPGGDIAKDVGSNLVRRLNPVGTAMRASEEPEGVRKALWGLASVSFPKSPAVAMATRLEVENIGTAMTREQRNRWLAKREISQMYADGKVDRPAIDKMVQDGTLTKQDVARARVSSKVDPVARATRNLSLDQALNVYDVATPDEKKSLRPVIARKAREIQQEPDKEKREALRQRLHDALHGNETVPQQSSAKAAGAML